MADPFRCALMFSLARTCVCIACDHFTPILSRFPLPNATDLNNMAGIDLNAPVSPAPKGFVQNLDNPPNQAVLAYTTLSLAFTFATLFAWSRILIKLRLRNKLFVEDCKSIAVLRWWNRPTDRKQT